MRHLICAILAMPFPAFAAELPDMRESCTPLYTVQKQACIVENVWRCDGEEEGEENVLFVNETIFPDYIDTKFYNEEYEQVAPLTSRWKRKIKRKGAFAMSDFLADGQDMLFEGGQLDLLGDGYPLPVQIEGEMRLTGEQVTLSGDMFERAETKLVGRVGPLKYLKSGDAYFDRETRTIFGGAFSHGVPPNLMTVESHPVEIIRAGEDGFMAEAGVYGCAGANG